MDSMKRDIRVGRVLVIHGYTSIFERGMEIDSNEMYIQPLFHLVRRLDARLLLESFDYLKN